MTLWGTPFSQDVSTMSTRDGSKVTLSSISLIFSLNAKHGRGELAGLQRLQLLVLARHLWHFLCQLTSMRVYASVPVTALRSVATLVMINSLLVNVICTSQLPKQLLYSSFPCICHSQFIEGYFRKASKDVTCSNEHLL